MKKILRYIYTVKSNFHVNAQINIFFLAVVKVGKFLK